MPIVLTKEKMAQLTKLLDQALNPDERYYAVFLAVAPFGVVSEGEKIMHLASNGISREKIKELCLDIAKRVTERAETDTLQ